MSASNTLTIEVKPDTSNQPKVHLNNRDANSKQKIKWVKANDATHFTFICLAPFTDPMKNPFKKIKVNKNRIKCKFVPADDCDNKKYYYTIVIEANGVPYNSDDPQNPNHGRAVIRN